MKRIKVNDIDLDILAGYEETTYEGLKEGCFAFKRESPISYCLVVIEEIKEADTIPFDNNRIVIDSIHYYLGENQGLVDVKNGISRKYSPYVYSIVKTVDENDAVQYNLTFQIRFKNGIINITGFGQELDNYGSRETSVFNMLNEANKISASALKRWEEDPFDRNYKKGKLKNYSENKEFDKKFPNHPLSVLRRFADSVIENN